MRAFALTLSFYSPRAYNFVRKTFNNILPHPTTLSRWYQIVDGAPGFTREALVALKLRTEEAKAKEKQLVCNLVFDEVSIRKQVEWTGKKFTGYIDIGTRIESDTLPAAKEALVFMLVCLNESWKIPVGYFLIDGLSGSEKAELLKKCLEFVNESGVIVSSITFDGAPANFTMCKHLGANFENLLALKTVFNHPVTNDKIFIFPDPCHMIKLIRNCFASQKYLKDYEGQLIDWDFLVKLVELQNIEGLQAATKIRTRHLQWVREKMKVRIATQTLSKSVADALLYLSQDLRLKEFENCAATAKFVQLFNDLFDMFNSRSRFSKYLYKRPLSQITYDQFSEYLDTLKNYIFGLSLGGSPIVTSQRKTGFIGFLICIESLKEFYQLYIIREKKMKYVLTYKLSQDHLELFFGSIRSMGGYNNNPTARQFEAAYKRLIVHNEVVAADSGNAINLDATNILYCSSTQSLTKNDDNEDLQQTSEYLQFEQAVANQVFDQDYLISDAWNLTDYTKDVASYISGFVVKTLKKCVTCTKCQQLLEGDVVLSGLQMKKTYGRMTNASSLVVGICQAGEKYFRFFDKTTGVFNKKVRNLPDLLISNTTKNIPISVYSDFGDHYLDDEPMDSHLSKLIKLILSKYFKIRIHHKTSKQLENNQEKRVRSLLNKTILFKGQ